MVKHPAGRGTVPTDRTGLEVFALALHAGSAEWFTEA
eukprot:COSAG06_NODE_33029_length_496_cov_1.297229_1_plen_36_part_01